MDTPGLREVGTWGLDPEGLGACFPEFRPFLDGCRFDNCRHLTEPGCAVRKAAEETAALHIQLWTAFPPILFSLALLLIASLMTARDAWRGLRGGGPSAPASGPPMPGWAVSVSSFS